MLADLHESAFHDVHSEPAAIPDDERFLVEALVRANRHGFLKPLRIEMDVDFYFQRAWLDTTSGEIQTMTVELHLKGKSTSVTLATVMNTRAEFTDVQSRVGSNVYDTTPTKSIHIDTMVGYVNVAHRGWRHHPDSVRGNRLQRQRQGKGPSSRTSRFRSRRPPLAGGQFTTLAGNAIASANNRTRQTFAADSTPNEAGVSRVTATGDITLESGLYLISWFGGLTPSSNRTFANLDLAGPNGATVVGKSNNAYLRAANTQYEVGVNLLATVATAGAYRLAWDETGGGTIAVAAGSVTIAKLA